MTDDLDIRRWTWKDRLLLWAICILVTVNLVISVLTLGPDILNW